MRKHDAAFRKQDAERVRLWRLRNPGAHRRYQERRDEQEERRIAAARFATEHRHTCVTWGCRQTYICTNKCDPKGLKDSLCPTCYKAAAAAPAPEPA